MNSMGWIAPLPPHLSPILRFASDSPVGIPIRVMRFHRSLKTLSRYCKKHNTAGSVLLKYVKFFGTTKSFT
ncbi:hypothetical protein ACSBR2_011744 [Camellia fascicularis]